MAKVYIDKNLCKGCELCVITCRLNVLEMDQKNINAKGYYPANVVEPDKCTGCANCAIMCPDSAIKINKA